METGIVALLTTLSLTVDAFHSEVLGLYITKPSSTMRTDTAQ
jgi:hypothetical protein